MWLHTYIAASADSLLRRKFRFLATIGALICGCFIPSPTTAQVTRQWFEPTGQGYFHVAQNWMPAGVPGPTDTVVFDVQADHEVWWNSQTATNAPSVGFLQVADSDVSFVNQEPTTQWELLVSGSGGAGSFSDMSFSGVLDTFVTNLGLNLHSLGGAQILDLAKLTIDGSPASSSRLRVDGAIGLQNDGTLNVISGGVVETTLSFIGHDPIRTGVATVAGTDANGNRSTWNSSEELLVGYAGVGTLQIIGGGLVATASNSHIGYNPGSRGVATVSGADANNNRSTWNNSLTLFVGLGGDGTLEITSGGLVSDSVGVIAYASGSVGAVTVAGIGGNGNRSHWSNSGNFYVGHDGNGMLEITAGGLVSNANGRIGFIGGSIGAATVDGTDPNGIPSHWNNAGDLHVGDEGDGTLNISGGGLVSSTNGVVAYEPDSAGAVTVVGTDAGGAPSTWNNTNDLVVGRNGSGTLEIRAGGFVSNANGFLGLNSNSVGAVTVDGSDANGIPSTWSNSGSLFVAYKEEGILNITNGGRVSNAMGWVGFAGDSAGAVTVAGSDASGSRSTWSNSSELNVGNGSGALTVASQGLVEVAGRLKIWELGSVTIDGGTIALDSLEILPGGTFAFNVGTLNFTNNLSITAGDSLQTALGGSHAVSFGKTLQVDGASTLNNVLTIDGGTFSTGQLLNPQWLQFTSGTIRFTGASGMSVGASGPFSASLTLGGGQNLEVTNTLSIDPGGTVSLSGGNVSAGSIDNNGRLTGAGTLHGSLSNNVGGEVEVLAGQQLRFTGQFVSNFGEVNNFGGQVRFDGEFINNDTGNDDTGFVAGRGQFIADGGWTNQGVMAFSAGVADVLGDVFNDFGGRIITSGGATTTFFDDATHNGTEIRTAAGSNTVFFGAVSGTGPYTGTGTVYFEGDLRPGNSAAAVVLAGDVVFGSSLTSEFEIGGTVAGSQFDQLQVSGHLALDGTLNVSFINGFLPEAGDSFDILDWKTVDGEFAAINLPSLGGLTWNTSQLYTTGVLSVVPNGIPGDYNNDGTVDAADYVLFRKHEGTNTVLANDPIGGVIGQAQHDQWRAHFGQAANSGSVSSANVPEPETWTLLALAAAVNLVPRRRFGTCLARHSSGLMHADNAT